MSIIEFEDKADLGTTLLSLQATVDAVKKKYGNDWLENEEAKHIVIWVARLFDQKGIREVCPQLVDLCAEYRSLNTVNNKTLPANMLFLAFNVFEDGKQKD